MKHGSKLAHCQCMTPVFILGRDSYIYLMGMIVVSLPGSGGGGNSHIKMMGVLVVMFRG